MLGTTDPLQEDLFEWTGLLRDVINWETVGCIRSPGKELKALVKVLERLARCKVLATLAEDQNSISSTSIQLFTTVYNSSSRLELPPGLYKQDDLMCTNIHVDKTHKYILKDPLKTFVSSQPWMLGPFPCFDTGFYGIRLAWSSLCP